MCRLITLPSEWHSSTLRPDITFDALFILGTICVLIIPWLFRSTTTRLGFIEHGMVDNTCNSLSSCFPEEGLSLHLSHLPQGSESTCVIMWTRLMCPGGNRAFRLYWWCNEQLSALNLSSVPWLLSQTKCCLVREQTNVKQEPAAIALTCPAGSAVRRTASLAFLASVVAQVTLLLKFKLPGGTVQNTSAIIKNPGGKAGG